MGDINQRNIFGSNVIATGAVRILTLRSADERWGFIKGVAAAVLGGLILHFGFDIG